MPCRRVLHTSLHGGLACHALAGTSAPHVTQGSRARAPPCAHRISAFTLALEPPAHSCPRSCTPQPSAPLAPTSPCHWTSRSVT